MFSFIIQKSEFQLSIEAGLAVIFMKTEFVYLEETASMTRIREVVKMFPQNRLVITK